jgi:septum formation topological specificity factor MinE
MSFLKKFRHSASSASKIKNAPQVFIADKIFGIKQPYGEAALRGNVAEAIARYILAKNPTDEQIQEYALKKWEKLK